MKKILIHGPILSCSGYGEMARLAFNALTEHEDKFDIYINNINWGKTSYLHEETQEYLKILKYRIKTEKYFLESNKNPQFDISLQITIPNEWKRIAAVNIGYTAGIETTHISPSWLEPSNMMDKIITISNFSKQGFLNTVFSDGSGNQFKINTDIETVYFAFKETKQSDLNLKFSTEFNFLCVNQWGPRKNLETLINCFLEEFKDDNVGLVLKVNRANDSTTDKFEVEKSLKNILDLKKDRKCKVYLLHGRMSDEEMSGLYNHPSVKAFVTATHGEGFGLPIFEAMQAEMPVIATDWSAHLEFLSIEDKKMFAKVDFEIGQIQKEHVWPGVMEENVGWAFPKANSLKARMREVYKDHGRFKSWAKKLAAHNKEKFTKEKIYDAFYNAVVSKLPETFQVENNLFIKKKLDIDSEIKFIEEPKETKQDIKKISFCISTNGKKVDKTLKSISSIKKASSNCKEMQSEIIVCGDIGAFEGKDVLCVDAAEDAHKGMLAKLRNRAAEFATGDVIVFLDDDIIFPEDWLTRLVNYNKENSWDVLGNRIYLPDGGRYWDRAILNPHQMVPYNFNDGDPRLYQTGCFWVLRSNVFEKHKWDSSIEYYAQKNGKVNEDVEYSDRLKKAGYKLKFDPYNLVWHWDDSYQEVKINEQTLICLKKDMIPAIMFKQTEPLKEFVELLQGL